jgi:hypothetical protein
MTEHEELGQIRRLIGIWLNEIYLANAEFYFDINKVSEDLCRQLLNLVYDYELLDLNVENKVNFPGLDIGDRNNAKIAFQVTSRTDRQKVIKNLQTVTKNGYEKVFISGIKFLILKLEDRVTFTKNMDPTKILPSFDPAKDIIYPEDVIKTIKTIYEIEGDLIKFNKIKALLEKELYPKFPSHVIQEQAKEIKALTQLMEKSIEKGTADDFTTSWSYSDDDLQIPIVKNIVARDTLIEYYISLLTDSNILWVKGPFSTGKTSIAVSVCGNSCRNTLWVECRGIAEEQLVDHLLNSLAAFFKVKRKPLFKSMVADLIAGIPEEALLVLNDLAQLNPVQRHKDKLSFIFRELESAGHWVLVTSNYSAPDSFSGGDGLEIISEDIPPFLPSETAELLQSYGASIKVAEAICNQITSSTQGHPLLIRSAAKYLKERKWKINDEELRAIFTGKFDASTDKATYAKLLNETSDVKTVELLYRMKYIIGSFSKSLVYEVAQVEPSVDRVDERLNELSEIWLQQNSNGKYQVSPLIKHLDDNINRDLKNGIYLILAKNALSLKPVSPVDASSAILYYSLANDHNNAAIVLINVLHAFAKSPELFFEWGLDMHWFYTQLPEDIIPHFRVQIRVGQLQLAKVKDKEITFLREDLISIISKKEIGLLDRYLGNTALFQIDFNKHPLLAMDELTQIQEDSRQIESNDSIADLFKEEGQVLVDDNLLNGIWMIFVQLKSLDEFQSWFEKLPSTYPESIINPQSNEAYAMAGASIFRNVVAADPESDSSFEILTWLLKKGLEKELYLIATYSLKYLMKYMVGKHDDLDGAISLMTSYQELLKKSYIYDYLVKAELGAMCLLKGERKRAFEYLSPLRDTQLPSFYIEQFDYLIATIQVYFDYDKEISAVLSSRALELAKGNQSIPNEDKCKLYGEAAVGLTHTGRTTEALFLLTEGYEMVLENFVANDEFKAIIIRYGNAILYVVEKLTYHRPRNFGDKGKFDIPEPGFFYRNNDALIQSGIYFEERKYMVAAIATDGFEAICDFENAKKWAYKSVHLMTSLLEEPRFVALIQKFVFYPVDDKLYLQAYNMLAEVQRFYQRLKKEVEDEGENEEKKELVARATASKSLSHDVGIYLYILFPVALDFSLRILQGELKTGDYQKNINAAFDPGKYNVMDREEFAYAKSIFEGIIIQNLDYTGFMEIHQKKTSENKDFIQAISCILLSTFANPTEAANLHLANVVTLDSTFSNTITSFYNFQVIPYFENFWKLKFQNHPREFLKADDLSDRGFPLIEKTPPRKRIKKLFFVLSHHLRLTLSPQIEEFIEPED